MRLARVHDPDVAVAILTRPPLAIIFTRPTHRLLRNRLPGTRPFPRWRWRDALFEGPSRQRLGRTKLAEPSRDRALQFLHRLSRKARPPPTRFCGAKQRQGHAFSPRLSRSDHPPSISLSGVRVRRAREITALYALRCYETGGCFDRKRSTASERASRSY
jgi:hypothetical protein